LKCKAITAETAGQFTNDAISCIVYLIKRLGFF